MSVMGTPFPFSKKYEPMMPPLFTSRNKLPLVMGAFASVRPRVYIRIGYHGTIDVSIDSNGYTGPFLHRNMSQ